MYNKKPKMILFDVGGTLFNDGKCIAEKGFFALLKASENPDVTNEKELSQYWDEYMNEILIMEMDPVTGAQPKLIKVFELD